MFGALLVEEDEHGSKNKERMRKMNKRCGGSDFGLDFMVCVCVVIG